MYTKNLLYLFIFCNAYAFYLFIVYRYIYEMFIMIKIDVELNWMDCTYLLFFLCWCGRRIEFADMLFGLDAELSELMLLMPCNGIELSLLPRKLLATITRDAPSKRSFKLSPTKRKFGKRIQHVFTVHEPDIPWHLHSCRISDCTCCNRRLEKGREFEINARTEIKLSLK